MAYLRNCVFVFIILQGLMTSIHCGNVLRGMSASKADTEEGLSVLMIAPGITFTRSHMFFALNVAKVLAQKHKVVFIVTFAQGKDCPMEEAQNINNLEIHCHYPTGAELLKTHTEFLTSKNLNLRFWYSWQIFKEIIDKKDELKYLEGKFDVGIAEWSTSNQHSFAVFHALGIEKTVAMKPGSLLPQMYHDMVEGKDLIARLLGYNPPVPLVTETEMRDHLNTKKPERKAKIEAQYKAATDAVHNAIKEIDPNFQHLKGANGKAFPGLVKLYKETAQVWVGSLAEIEWDGCDVIKDVAKVKMIGGIHFEENPKITDATLNKKLAALKKTHKHPKMVLISFGSIEVVTNNMTPVQLSAIEKAVEDFVTKHTDFLVVWKLSTDHPSIKKFADNSNVYATAWVEQQAILADKRTMAFMNHCGRNSQLEGAANGKPMVCVPMANDGFYDSESMALRNLATVLDYKNTTGTESDAFTKDNIVNALEEAIGTCKKQNKNDCINVQKVKQVGESIINRFKTNGPKKMVASEVLTL